MFGEPGSPEHFSVVRGRCFVAFGWVADENGAVPGRVYAVLDRDFRLRARTVKRPDIAEAFGVQSLFESGFDATFTTDALSAGTHHIALICEFDDGSTESLIEADFEVVEDRNAVSSPRILIAAAPKSGSTFTSNALREYFGLREASFQDVDWEAPHGLPETIVERLRGRPYVIQMHVLPFFHNLQAIERERISTIVTWRNLGDTLVSLDDHVAKEGGFGSITYMDARAFLAMPQQARYQFLIRHVIPWYVDFYCMWKRVDRVTVQWANYERLASDPRAYLTDLLHCVGETRIDAHRLEGVLGAKFDYAHARRNAGVNGRSVEALSEETKEMLESLLRAHFEPLDDLVAELPWNAR